MRLSPLFYGDIMLKCYALTDKKQKEFYALFGDYYAELGCDEDTEHLLDEYVVADLKAGLLSVYLLDEGEKTVGFVIFQTDRAENEWCKKAGWGDVRELYVEPSSRGKGLGKFMLLTAEMFLRESGAKDCYCLPAEGTEAFFLSCGYAESEERCEEMDCPFFTKDISSSPCNCEKQ